MQQETVPACRGSELATRGIRVRVVPSFVREQSDPVQNRFVFAYRVRVANESPRAVQLLSREWRIVDADGECNIVRGEGVVGQQPELAPGASFEYSSFCPLITSWGTMEGRYTFRDQDGDEFEVPIARFYLVAPPP
ncbi:MAG: Co2+/Mg2+ efflux protein ApaG [Phycisphaeraceae bacterium]|nr:Co2+/Mg2+ efflux protein ApaG [Phycisphaeraceae bacterium]